MTSFDSQKQSQLRQNPLTGDWVLVSPGRTQRPWKGQTETPASLSVPPYDPECYMCPGNTRAKGQPNPHYEGTFVFDNDYPALEFSVEPYEQNESGVLVERSEQGICRVICFTPRHDWTLARMPQSSVREVVDVWTEQYVSIGAKSEINSVMIFENRGAMMGASNPHLHGQIWANATIPNEAAKEQASLVAYQRAHSTCLLCEYLKIEQQKSERIVCQNENFTALVPFWAEWPFEILVLPNRHIGSLDQFSDSERDGLADILQRVTQRYDHLFATSFPYSMGFHQRPTDGQLHPEWHFHAHFYPPLCRREIRRRRLRPPDVIRAAIDLQNGKADEAIQALLVAEPYDLAYPEDFNSLTPTYVRGLAYLRAGDGQQAAAQFQKLIDHPGIVGRSALGALARVQLAQSQKLAGNNAAARNWYVSFLTLWKDADPGIPIYITAKSEYSKLQ